MNWREFSFDPITGVRTWFAHDPVAKKNHFRTEQDVEPILELNKAMASHGDGGWTSKAKEMRRVASIPAIVLEMWTNKYGTDPLAKGNEKLLRRLLNDPENRFLRTGPGRL